MVNKTCILNKIKEFYGLKTNKELSEFLGVTKQTISNWYSRNTLDYDIILTKCKDVDLHWLLLGSTEKSVDIMLNEATDTTKEAAQGDNKFYQDIKFFNGMSSLYNYLIRRYNYSDSEKMTNRVFDSVHTIQHFVEENYIRENFYKLYEKFKLSIFTQEELLTEFESIISKNEEIRLMLGQYEAILDEISSKILDKEFPNMNYSDFFDENGKLRI